VKEWSDLKTLLLACCDKFPAHAAKFSEKKIQIFRAMTLTLRFLRTGGQILKKNIFVQGCLFGEILNLAPC
jgi:hypothetical protein